MYLISTDLKKNAWQFSLSPYLSLEVSTFMQCSAAFIPVRDFMKMLFVSKIYKLRSKHVNLIKWSEMKPCGPRCCPSTASKLFLWKPTSCIIFTPWKHLSWNTFTYIKRHKSIKGHLCTHSHDFFSSLLSIINIHITKQHTKLSCKYMNWTLLLSYFSGCQWAVWMLIMREVPWCSGWWVCKVPNPEGTSSAWPFCGPLLGHSCVPQCGQDHGKWPVQAWQEEQGCFACLWRLR